MGRGVWLGFVDGFWVLVVGDNWGGCCGGGCIVAGMSSVFVSVPGGRAVVRCGGSASVGVSVAGVPVGASVLGGDLCVGGVLRLSRLRPVGGRTWSAVGVVLRRSSQVWGWAHDLLVDTLVTTCDFDELMELAPQGHAGTWCGLLWRALALRLVEQVPVVGPWVAVGGGSPGSAGVGGSTVVFPSLVPLALPCVLAAASLGGARVELLDSGPVTVDHVSTDPGLGLPASALGGRLDEAVRAHVVANIAGADVTVRCPSTVDRSSKAVWVLVGEPAVAPETYAEVVEVAFGVSSGGPVIWPVSVEDSGAWIGPAETRHSSGCHYCHWLRRHDCRPRWASQMVRALNHRRKRPAGAGVMVPPVLRQALAAQLMTFAGQVPPMWMIGPDAGHAVHISASPQVAVKRVESTKHPRCRCCLRNVGHTRPAHMAQAC